MKNFKIFIIVIIILIILIIGLFLLNNYIKKNNNVNNQKIDTVEKVELGKEVWINSLKKVFINDSSDYIEITESVKFSSNLKGSFSIAIPYIIHVNDLDYNGEYILGSGLNNEGKDDNPIYNLQIINITKDGLIKILVTNK